MDTIATNATHGGCLPSQKVAVTCPLVVADIQPVQDITIVATVHAGPAGLIFLMAAVGTRIRSTRTWPLHIAKKLDGRSNGRQPNPLFARPPVRAVIATNATPGDCLSGKMVVQICHQAVRFTVRQQGTCMLATNLAVLVGIFRIAVRGPGEQPMLETRKV